VLVSPNGREVDLGAIVQRQVNGAGAAEILDRSWFERHPYPGSHEADDALH